MRRFNKSFPSSSVLSMKNELVPTSGFLQWTLQLLQLLKDVVRICSSMLNSVCLLFFRSLSCISVVVCCCERPLEEHEQEWSRRGIERVAFIDAAAPTWAAMKGEELPSNSKGNVFSPEELSAEALQHAITDAVQSTVSRTPMEGARESHAETRGLLFIVDSISLLLNLYSGEKKDEGKVVGAITSTLKAKSKEIRCCPAGPYHLRVA